MIKYLSSKNAAAKSEISRLVSQSSAVPIVIFAYNRPLHLYQCLLALSKNPQAANTSLFIYCDAAKSNANEKELMSIKEVRSIAENENRFKEVKVIFNQENKGLARSIIEGVTHLIKIYGRLIILEDDILVETGFLTYMNEALSIYESEGNVGCIHAWNYNLKPSAKTPKTFFLRGADCWGWATWERAWQIFNPNGVMLLNEILKNGQQYEFDRRGTHDFTKMLQGQIQGENDSWAIRWHASLFLNNMYCLHPTRTLVTNIGLDGSGIHSGKCSIEQSPVDFIKVEKIPVVDSDWFYRAYARYRYGDVKNINYVWKKLKDLLKAAFPR